MRFDFASRRTAGGLPTLELNGTDQLKKGSSWPLSSGVETMSTMPGETRVVINWSSQFIDKTRVCLARHPSFSAHKALRPSPRPRIRPRGVMARPHRYAKRCGRECWSVGVLRQVQIAPRGCGVGVLGGVDVRGPLNQAFP